MPTRFPQQPSIGAPKPPLDMLAERRPAGRPRPPESIDDRDWHERVAREALHQELIEATFDRAEAHERLGDFERALEWLDRAAALGGDLPPAYRARHDRWLRAASHRRERRSGGWRDPLVGWELAGRAR